MLVTMATSNLEFFRLFNFLAPSSPHFDFAQYFKAVKAAQALGDIVFHLTCSEASTPCGIHDNMTVQAW
jgi:hypothetical protein